MAIESKNLLTVIKANARANKLPLDYTEVWESLAEAQAYLSNPTAYDGQTIKAKLDDGKYHTYTIQPSAEGYVLEELGSNNQSGSGSKQYVQIVTALPTSGQEQGILYINTTDSIGSIWTGSAWKEVFRDVQSRLAILEKSLDEKAPIANPAFTGSVTLDGKALSTKEYAESLVAGLNGFSPGIVDQKNGVPTTGYKVGQSWRVAEAGTYVGQKCEVGDLILVLSDCGEAISNDDFMVIQANIDGAVTGADSSVDGNIVVFDGVTGKIIKDSTVSIASLNDVISKAHTHTNASVLDTYDKTQSELLAEAKIQANDELAKKADKSTTLSGYGITDAYTKTEVDNLLTPISENLNTKVDSATVDSKITDAKTTILTEAATTASESLAAKVGAIPEDKTVKEYVDSVVGTGGTDISQQLADNLAAAKTYTDTQISDALTIVEF